MTIIEIFLGLCRFEFKKASRVPFRDEQFPANTVSNGGNRNWELGVFVERARTLGETQPMERIRKNVEWGPVVGAHTWTQNGQKREASSLCTDHFERPGNSGKKMCIQYTS